MSFTVYSSVEQKVIARVGQIPLGLSFRVFIHKAKSLSMDRVEVDCSNILYQGCLVLPMDELKRRKYCASIITMLFKQTRHSWIFTNKNR